MTGIDAPLRTAVADRYRIERELGAGGMATVYLAHDLKHERKVAIKVLRPDLAAVIGAERFLREIRTIAALQHPHILGLIDSGGVNGTAFYVMPFAEGESLRDRLNREKQLPIADAIRIACEVASALDYAHRHGIVHRDIKPENVMLHDGSALVADFGIALAVSSAGGTRMTETGMSLGTPHYMSPEQAMGEREITARSDVYALGAITYEMLVGEPPFTGPTAQAIVAKVMTAEPVPLSGIRKTVPSSVDHAVRTALQKLPADRYASAAEFAAALDAPAARTGATSFGGAATSSPRWRRVSMALGVLSLALAGLSAWALTRERAAMGPRVYDTGLPDSAALAFAATTVTSSYGLPLRNLSVAPSGEFVVYTVQQGDSATIWYRSLRDAAARPIPGTAGGVAPRVSPDGQRIEFQRSGRVMVVPVAGGVARQLMDGTAVMSVEWISPTQLLVSDQDGYRVSWLDVDQGLVRSKPSQRCAFGTWIPGERRLTCSLSMTGTVLDPDSNVSWMIRSARPDGTPGPPLPGSDFRVIANRYLLYMSVDGELRAAHYDPARHLAGRSVTVLTGLRREAVGDAQYDLTQNGTLVYAPGADAGTGRMVRLSSGGTAQPLPLPQASYQRFDVSPDGRRLAVVVQTPEGQELRISNLRTGQQLTWLRGEYVGQPLWSRDGARLLLSARDSTRSAILMGAPSSGLPPDTLVVASAPGMVNAPMDFPAEHLALASNNTTSMILAFDPSARPLRFDTVAADSRFTMMAPDERHVVYQTAQTGRIIVAAWPGSFHREQVSDGGVEPIWLSASQLLYRLGVSWYVVRIDPVSGAPVGPPALWARDPRFSDTAGWSNRVSRDGGIVYVQGPEQTHASYLRVVPNWVAGMKSAVNGAGP